MASLQKNMLDGYGKLQFAKDGLSKNKSCFTTFLSAGDRKAHESIHRETLRVLTEILDSGDLGLITLQATEVPILNPDPNSFELDMKRLNLFKHSLRKKHPNSLARVFISPSLDFSESGFVWHGRAIVFGFERLTDLTLSQISSNQSSNNRMLDGFEPREIMNPNSDDLTTLMEKFQGGVISMLRNSRECFQQSVSRTRHPASSKIVDGLRQFDTLMPLKKCFFGHAIGQDVIKRALVSMETDVKLAKRNHGPDQLEMLHEWWCYYDRRRPRSFRPLKICN